VVVVVRVMRVMRGGGGGTSYHHCYHIIIIIIIIIITITYPFLVLWRGKSVKRVQVSHFLSSLHTTTHSMESMGSTVRTFCTQVHLSGGGSFIIQQLLC
jgi:type II secretory pathway pseudopilin PulG